MIVARTELCRRLVNLMLQFPGSPVLGNLQRVINVLTCNAAGLRTSFPDDWSTLGDLNEVACGDGRYAWALCANVIETPSPS